MRPVVPYSDRPRHPFGITGARIMTTLLNDLATVDATYAMETRCVAGGMGQVMIVERLA
jgi:acetyl-CoA C-acetyltransferase